MFACEIDKFARKTYEANFKPLSPGLFDSGNFAEDITTVDANKIPDFDILCAGFPCQAFSIAGKRKGFTDPRGQLFFDIIRILKAKQPRAFILENVRGLLSMEKGKTFETMLTLLKEAGYTVFYKVLRACDYGVPQLRPRVFIVGFKANIAFEFPAPIPLTKTLSDVFKGNCTKEVAYTLTIKGLGKQFGHPKCMDVYLVNGVPKRLGVDEARQIMGIPDWFVFPGSRSQTMKQLGNAVVAPVVKFLSIKVLKTLEKIVA